MYRGFTVDVSVCITVGNYSSSLAVLYGLFSVLLVPNRVRDLLGLLAGLRTLSFPRSVRYIILVLSVDLPEPELGEEIVETCLIKATTFGQIYLLHRIQ